MTAETKTTTGITADFAVLAQDLLPVLRAFRFHGKGKPIAPDVLCSASESHLRLTATAKDASVSVRFPVDPRDLRVPGACIVPFAALHEVTCAASTVRCIVNGNVALSNVEMHSEFPLRDASQYPSLPQGDHPVARFDAGELRAALGKVMHAAAQDNTRPSLAGVHMEIEGAACTLVTTDGYRLAWQVVSARYNLSTGVEAGPVSVILARDAVVALLDVLPDDESAVVMMTGNSREYATFAGKDWRCTVKLVQGQYPRWRMIVPEQSDMPFRVMVNRLQLLKAAKAATKATKPRSKHADKPSMRLTLSRDSITAAWYSRDDGVAEQTIEGIVNGLPSASTSMVVSFDPSFLVDACQYGSGESLHMHLKDSHSAMLINGSYVLMPMHLPSR